MTTTMTKKMTANTNSQKREVTKMTNKNNKNNSTANLINKYYSEYEIAIHYYQLENEYKRLVSNSKNKKYMEEVKQEFAKKAKDKLAYANSVYNMINWEKMNKEQKNTLNALRAINDKKYDGDKFPIDKLKATLARVAVNLSTDNSPEEAVTLLDKDNYLSIKNSLTTAYKGVGLTIYPNKVDIVRLVNLTVSVKVQKGETVGVDNDTRLVTAIANDNKIRLAINMVTGAKMLEMKEKEVKNHANA